MNRSWLMGAALLLSLAGNAFLGGILLGKPEHPGMMGPMHADSGMPRLKHLMHGMRDLPEEQRQQVHQTMREFAPPLRELARQNLKERETIQQKLLLPELPRAELEADFARQREMLSRMQAMHQQMLLDIASQLSPEQRAGLLMPGPH